jgi:non-specific protein-tyrosine kinase
MNLTNPIKEGKKIYEQAKHAFSAKAQVRDMDGDEKLWISLSKCQVQCVEIDRQSAAENRCVCLFPDAPELESYKFLRTRIEHRCKEKGWNNVMITSVQPGEGKTLTSINLALAFARRATQEVLLVDCDLKRQNIQHYLCFAGNKGLVDNLVDGVPLDDLIRGPGIERLSIISGGKPVDKFAELLGSPRMESAVGEMKRRCANHFIIFDAPPLLSSADALAFSFLVDCVIIVVEAARTGVKDIRTAAGMIPKEKFRGFVLNRERSSKKGYTGYN